MSERLLGPIVLLQVQAEPLKAPGVYDPAPLRTVEEASVSARGMLGWDGSAWVVDAHHVEHPRSRGGGRRALSIGLTGHYASIGERFPRSSVGIGSENIIVDGPGLRLPEIADGFVVRRPDGTEIDLFSPRVAAPCVEFTSYLLEADGVLARDQILDDLAFLSEGTRGHIVDISHLDRPVALAVGDEVYLR